MTKIYVGDIGTEIILDCGTDISTATTAAIKVDKPDNTTVTWTGEVYNTNYIKYTTEEDDIDLAGVWMLQSYVVAPAGTWLGNTVRMTVYDAFE